LAPSSPHLKWFETPKMMTWLSKEENFREGIEENRMEYLQWLYTIAEANTAKYSMHSTCLKFKEDFR